MICTKCGNMCWRVLTGGPPCIQRPPARSDTQETP
jgi:hypothetical protein